MKIVKFINIIFNIIERILNQRITLIKDSFFQTLKPVMLKAKHILR